MNTAAIKKTKEFSNALLFPSFFPLIALALSFLVPSSITPFLPLFSAAALFSCWRYKGIGLSFTLISLALLFLFSREGYEKTWQIGLMIALSFSFVIVYLTKLDVDQSLLLEEEEKEKIDSMLKALKAELDQSKESWLQERAELEEELNRWKEEAHQRRIDKAQDERKFFLLQEDIKLYLNQKEELILAAQTANSDEDLKKQLAHLNGCLNQLKVQFEEKSKTLAETRKELFHTQTALIALQKQAQEDEQSEIRAMQQELKQLNKEKEDLEEEVIQLEELISRIRHL